MCLFPDHESNSTHDALIFRQCFSLYAITFVGILLLYFSFAGLSYYFFFNHEMKKHPRFLKNQVRLEIESSLNAFAPLDLLTLPWFLGEVRGHSLLYNNISDYGLAYAIFSVPFFLIFTDACIYWVHRLEHHPRLYKHIHKPHHKWLGESDSSFISASQMADCFSLSLSLPALDRKSVV